MSEADRTAALSLRRLRKSFGETVAVDSIDLDVPSGSFFGLVGPNGAGKTTTLKMTTGLLRPDDGSVQVVGVDVWDRTIEAKAAIGVLPEELRLFERLTGHELLTYTGLLRSMDADTVERRSQELLRVFDLEDAAGKLVVDYSHGMKKKIALACALLHDPKVLFLDEPFEGLDPVSARTIRSVLEHYIQRAGTVVFSSHVMEIVERLCNRVAVMHDGRIVADGDLDDVRAGASLEERFVQLVGASMGGAEDLEWLGSS